MKGSISKNNGGFLSKKTMEDPFHSEIAVYCGRSNSQEEILRNSKFAREDEFKTPPEDSRRSSSEDAPPRKLPNSRGGESDRPVIKTPPVETDCVVPQGERASSSGVDVVMEVLRWLAEEERQKKKAEEERQNKEGRRRDNDEPVDFLETVKRRGVVFPEPKWWHEKE